MSRQIRDDNHYLSALLKLIPTDIVAAYLAILGVLPDPVPNAKLVLTIVPAVLLFIIPFYLVLLFNVKRPSQVIFVMISFVVWVYTMGGPFKEFGIYESYIGSVILILWTLLIPLVYRKQGVSSGQ